MKLSIPTQNPANDSSSPSAPDKLRKLLHDLPKSDMGELTKQTYQILKDQNRQTMPVGDRLNNLEMLKDLSREILDGLKKHFINRTLPLPEKSKKIVYLNQAILQELGYGYEIIAQQSINQEQGEQNSIDDSTLSVAICRAINYQSEILLRGSEVYQPCPDNLWHDTHQLHLLAESKGLLDLKVLNSHVNNHTDNKEDNETDQDTTIANSYKRILLFALAHPATLRQSDCERIYKKLSEWSILATIEQQTPEKLVDCVFSMRVFEDKPPSHLNQKEITDGPILRTLDSCKLVSHIEDLIAEKTQHSQKLSVGDDIPLETLMALVSAWGHNTERRFSRTERLGHINVAIGLSKICKAIRESKKIENTFPEIGNESEKTLSRPDNNIIGAEHEFFNVPSGSNNDDHLSLKSIADDADRDDHLTIDDDSTNQWDMVARGRVITDAYDKEKQLTDTEQLEQRGKNSDSHWQIVNASPGGYCLRWNSDDTSSAQIGELIALQEFDSQNNFNWHVGVIRWMQYTQESGLEIGVLILSPKVEIATAQRENNLDEIPFDCIMMPAIKALNQSASTILPSHAFKTDSKLVVKCLHNIISMTLGKTREITGSFTQFYYNSTNIDKNIKPQLKIEEENEQDSFGEIWPSL